jgi:hypothetical protein
VLAEAAAGVTAVARSPSARVVVGLFCAQCAVRGALNVLTVVAALRLLHLGSSGVGFLTAAPGLGGLVGGVFAAALVGRRVGLPFGLGLVLWGVPIAAIGAWPHAAVALAVLPLVGAGNSVLDVAGVTLLQRVAPDEQLARVFGVLYGGAMGAVGIGSILVAPLISAFGTRGALAATGAFLPALAVMFGSRLLAIDREVSVPARELALVQGVPMFAPLSVAAKERLATKLSPRLVPAGEVVINAGEEGDGFFIVGEGEFDIDAGGRHTTAHRADYFGEIALLRDVPRTATVTAETDSQLLELHRDDFLAAITGHSVAHAAGHEVAASRLAADAAKSVMSRQ